MWKTSWGKGPCAVSPERFVFFVMQVPDLSFDCEGIHFKEASIYFFMSALAEGNH